MAKKNKKVFLGKKDATEMTRRYRDGEAAGVLAAEYGVAPQTVYAWDKRIPRSVHRGDAASTMSTEPIPNDELMALRKELAMLKQYVIPELVRQAYER